MVCPLSENIILAVIFAFSTAILTATFQTIARKGRSYGNAATGVVIGLVINSPILLLYSFFSWEPHWFNMKAIGLFIATGFAATGLGRFLLYFSIHKLGVAITSPLLSSIPLFTGLMAVGVLGETPELNVWLATILIVLGCVFITLKQESSGNWDLKYIWVPFASVLSYSVASIFRKMGLNILPEPLLGSTITYVAGLFLVLFLCLFMKGENKPNFRNKSAWIFYGFVGLINMLSLVSRWTSTSYADLTIVTPLFATSGFFALVISKFLLSNDEHVTIWSFIGTVLIVSGGAIITWNLFSG